MSKREFQKEAERKCKQEGKDRKRHTHKRREIGRALHHNHAEAWQVERKRSVGCLRAFAQR